MNHLNRLKYSYVTASTDIIIANVMEMEERKMNDFEKFKATLEIMEFHLNEDRIGETIISKWVYELNQILQMYQDLANINSGNVINKTEMNNDPYYGKENDN